MKNSKKILKGIICIIVVFFTVGCTAPAFTNKEKKTEITKTTEEENPKEAPSKLRIDFKDWPVKKNLVKGTDNLYQISIDEFSNMQGWIVALMPYENQFLVLEDPNENESNLYLVNPLTQEITATAKLPEGVYSQQDIQINEHNEIQIINSVECAVYFYDENLKQTEMIDFNAEQINGMVISKDHTFIYYLNGKDGCFYQYAVKDKESTRIFEDFKLEADNYGMLQALVDNDNCLIYSYYDAETESDKTIIRNLTTGEIRYNSENSVCDVNENDNEYVIKHNEDGLQETLYGKKTEDYPKVLAFSDYREYGQNSVNLDDKKVVSSMIVDDAKEIYLGILQNEKKDSSFLQDEDKVSSLTLNVYDLETGLRPYSMDFYYLYGEEGYFSNTMAVYLADVECVVMYLDCDNPQWLVWDLTKESSLSKDLENYLYAWQDPENPDRQTLNELRERAKKIGKENGVEIHLGADVASCPRDIYDYKISNNTIRIEKMLDLLEKSLAKYPKGLLAQLEDEYESVLHIYLSGGIVSISDEALETAIGIQNTIDGHNFLVLDINAFGNLDNTIYHEIFHAIEAHLYNTPSYGFDNIEWEKLNPEGFEYDYDYIANEENYNYDYMDGDTEHEVYFVDTYSKGFPNEDRARIIEYAMLDKEDARRHNIDGKGIQAKLKKICEVVRASFDTTGWPAKTVWEEAIIETE